MGLVSQQVAAGVKLLAASSVQLLPQNERLGIARVKLLDNHRLNQVLPNGLHLDNALHLQRSNHALHNNLLAGDVPLNDYLLLHVAARDVDLLDDRTIANGKRRHAHEGHEGENKRFHKAPFRNWVNK